MMPLTLASIGEVNTIRKVGGNEETRRFLENLGFIAGSEITVLSTISGNVIVNIKDSRVAINKEMARHIMVVVQSLLQRLMVIVLINVVLWIWESQKEQACILEK